MEKRPWGFFQSSTKECIKSTAGKHSGSDTVHNPGGGHGNLLSILAWKIPWTEVPGGLQSMGLKRVRHDWITNTFCFQMCVACRCAFFFFNCIFLIFFFNWRFVTAPHQAGPLVPLFIIIFVSVISDLWCYCYACFGTSWTTAIKMVDKCCVLTALPNWLFPHLSSYAQASLFPKTQQYWN